MSSSVSDFLYQEFRDQIVRPYWSPLHPASYVKDIATSARSSKMGWGIVYPDDIGAFNLCWLLSGVGLPPDDYERFAPMVDLIVTHSYDIVGRLTLKQAAAVLSLDRFFEALVKQGNPAHEPFIAAARLRV